MRKYIWILLIMAIVIGIIISIASYGYGGVGVDSSGNSTMIFEYEGEIEKLRDLLRPERVAIETTVDVHNNTIVPLYIPAMEHNLSLNGKPLCDTVYTDSIWLGPWGNETVPVSTSIPGNELPSIMLQYIQEYLQSGGNVDITVQSKARIAGITITRTQTVPFEMVLPAIAVRVT